MVDSWGHSCVVDPWRIMYCGSMVSHVLWIHGESCVVDSWGHSCVVDPW